MRPHATRRITCALVTLTVAICAQRASAQRSAAPSVLHLASRVDHVDSLAREPMIVQHPSGALFVAGYGGPLDEKSGGRPNWRTHLYMSRDNGATWSRVDVGAEARGLIGNSDVDLAVAPDGTLYYASMLFDAATMEGRRIAVGISRDAGATWTWSDLSTARYNDRPWIKVAPDGSAHAIWNDGSGVMYTTSRDAGHSWSKPTRIHALGGSSHLAIGPTGEMAVRVVPVSASGGKFDKEADAVVVSTDGGTSWQVHPPPARLDWKPLGDTTAITRWVDPLAWDRAGRLHAIWVDTAGVWLGRSTDQGASWTRWRIAACRADCFFPYLVARDAGELGASWMRGGGQTLAGVAARITMRPGMQMPHVARSAPFDFEAWLPNPKQPGALVRDPAGEYLAVTFLRGGGIAVVAPLQSPTRGGFSFLRFTP